MKDQGCISERKFEARTGGKLRDFLQCSFVLLRPVVHVCFDVSRNVLPPSSGLSKLVLVGNIVETQGFCCKYRAYWDEIV